MTKTTSHSLCAKGRPAVFTQRQRFLQCVAVFWLLGGLGASLAVLLIVPNAPVSETRGSADSLQAGRTKMTAYESKDIKDVEAGDEVLAVNATTGETVSRKVTRTFERNADHLRLLCFTDEQGGTQCIRTTDEHPFWTPDRGMFVEAAELRRGERVMGPAGEIQWILSSTIEFYPDGVTVYNLEIDDVHTYFVCSSDGRSDIPILVHNMCQVAREFEIGSRIRAPGMGDRLRDVTLSKGRDRLRALDFEELPPQPSGRITFRRTETLKGGGQRTHIVHFDPNDTGGANWHKYTVDKHGQIYELNDRGYVEAFGTNNPIGRVHIPGRQ